MNSIYSPNDLKSRKARAPSYFYEIPCQRSLFNISTENFKFAIKFSIKFTEFCRAGGK